jgi:hypothetical protein
MRFKEFYEGYWKDIDIQNQEKSSAKKSIPSIKFNILINGKIWTKKGIPVEFNNRDAAIETANTITRRYNKATQVAPSSS